MTAACLGFDGQANPLRRRSSYRWHITALPTASTCSTWQVEYDEQSRPAAVAVPDSTGACSRDAAWPTQAGLVRSSRVFSVLSRFPHARCVASSRGVCLILPGQPLFTSHLRGHGSPSQRPTPGNLRLCGRPFACSHKATCSRWPDFHVDKTHLSPAVEDHVPSLGSFRGKLLFQPRSHNASGGIHPSRGVLRYCSRGTPSTCFTFREACRPLCASNLSSSGTPLTCGLPWSLIEISFCRPVLSSFLPTLGLS